MLHNICLGAVILAAAALFIVYCACVISGRCEDQARRQPGRTWYVDTASEANALLLAPGDRVLVKDERCAQPGHSDSDKKVTP